MNKLIDLAFLALAIAVGIAIVPYLGPILFTLAALAVIAFALWIVWALLERYNDWLQVSTWDGIVVTFILIVVSVVGIVWIMDSTF